MIKKACRNKKTRNIIISLILIVLILNFFSVQAFADTGVVEEIKNILNNYYVDEVPSDVLNKDSAKEIITDLKDPYTQIIDQNDYKSIVDNTFIGIGITVEMKGTGAVITSIMVNSPAMKAGLIVGDIILAVDDNSIIGMSNSSALNLINGRLGTYCNLKVIRKNKTININVLPDKVYYPTVYSKVIGYNIGYLNILSFGPNTLAEFEFKINSPEMKNVKSYIFDLRNNLGGYLYSSIEVAGFFSKGNPIAIFQSKNGEKVSFRATEKKGTINKPTLFLVSKYTASAAELLAACVQDYGAAIIIGEKTYGKGVAQSTFKLSDGSIFKATTLKMYSPKGRDIGMGISPDINIKNTDSLFAGELLSESNKSLMGTDRTVKVSINENVYYINLDKVTSNNYLEAYRQIIGQATTLDASYYLQQSQNNKKAINSYPVLKYAEVPKTYYNIGERVIFRFNAPNYNGLVQYRAMLWDETTNKYVDFWKTADRYYDKWKPKGRDVFTISFPAASIGNYKIKVFIKRNGIQNSKAVLTGMNCDSYVYEIPFKIGVNN